MKLYYAATLNPRKVCALARHLGSPVEYVHVDLAKGEHRRPQFLALNPNGKVPVLATGERTIWESNAIMAHLARLAGSDLWPDEESHVEMVRWLSWNSEHFSRHASRLYFDHVIRPAFGLAPPDAAADQEATDFFRKSAKVLDDHLAGRRFVLGDRMTIVDFAVAVALPYAEKARLPLDDTPSIRRWHDRLNDLPAWREPFPTLEAAQFTAL